MALIDNRPGQVAARAGEILAVDECKLADAKILVAGVSYKPGVRDLRQSSAIPLIKGLLLEGAEVSYHDPLVPSVRLAEDTMVSTPDPHGEDYDLVIIHTMHPGDNYAWAEDCARVLDATYCFAGPKCVL